MKITTEEALRRFEADPINAAAFDAATRRERPHCKTRREAVVATLGAITALQAENDAKREQLRLARQKIAALETAKAAAARLKTSPAPLMSNQTMPTASAIAAEIVKAQAAAEAAAKLKTRAQFSELTPQAKAAFLKNGGKLN